MGSGTLAERRDLRHEPRIDITESLVGGLPIDLHDNSDTTRVCGGRP